MSRWSCALLAGLIALAVWGQVGRAVAEEPMTLLEDPVLVPADWWAMPVAEAFTKLADGQLNDPFHGRDKLADPWPTLSAKATVHETSCDCRCAEVLVPTDWR
jgi:hypothetical protein